MTTNNHPAHGPVSLKRLHQISEILSKAAAQRDGGNLGYAMADAVKVIDEVLNAEPVLYAAEETLAYAKMGELHLKCLSQPMGDAVIPLYTAPPAPVVQPVMFIDGDISASDAEKLAAVIREWDDAPAPERDRVRREHAEWSQATFGDVGPASPLKHLSKEALEAAAEPGDLSELADMQFLLWDAQRRAGISDEQITQAMVEKLAVNKQREWPEPKDGEPRLHIKEQPAPVVPDAANGLMPCPFCGGKAHQLTIEQDDDPHFGGDVITCTECWASSHVEFGFKENLKSAWNSRTAMLQAGNHTEQHLNMVDHSGDANEKVDCRLTFDQWLSQQNEPIDVDCGCVSTEAFYHWLRVAYEAGNSPVSPDGWIPVSEKMPPNKPGSYEYIVFDSLNNRAHHDYWNVPDGSCDDFSPFWNHYGKYVTHWMPLPAAPQQEVKRG